MQQGACAAVLGAAALLAGCVTLAADPPHLNPFNDPFLQATAGRPCPTPLGPAYTEAELRVEAHSRIERGTTCWLLGLCAEPNAYRYDAAQAARAEEVVKALADVDRVIPALALPGEKPPYALAGAASRPR